MIRGVVSDDGVPTILMRIAETDWPAMIDTGFNGDLELPNSLFEWVNPREIGEVSSFLAGGQIIDEIAYFVDMPFDGRRLEAIATFVEGGEILIGTRLLREYDLHISFPNQTVEIRRG